MTKMKKLNSFWFWPFSVTIQYNFNKETVQKCFTLFFGTFLRARFPRALPTAGFLQEMGFGFAPSKNAVFINGAHNSSPLEGQSYNHVSGNPQIPSFVQPVKDLGALLRADRSAREKEHAKLKRIGHHCNETISLLVWAPEWHGLPCTFCIHRGA